MTKENRPRNDKVWKDYQKGIGYTKLAKIYRRSVRTIRQIIKRYKDRQKVGMRSYPQKTIARKK